MQMNHEEPQIMRFVTALTFRSMLAVSLVCAGGVASAQTPAQPSASAVPVVHLSDAQQLPEPFNPKLHSIFVVGDSTAAYHNDRMNEGYAEAQGWGLFFYGFFDPDKVNVVTLSNGGRF